MKEQKFLSIQQYYLIKTVYVISIILCILTFAVFIIISILYIFSAAGDLLGDFSSKGKTFVFIYLVNCACSFILMLIFSAKSMNRLKTIKIAVIIFILSFIPFNISLSFTFPNWLSYIPPALLALLLILSLYVLMKKEEGRKLTHALFIILLCSVIGTFIFCEGLTLNYAFFAVLLIIAFKDKGFYKYFIESHPKYLIKGRRYYY